MKKISILGSTGSIGKSTLNVIRNSKNIYDVVALSCHSNILEIEKQIIEFKPKIVAVFDDKKAEELKTKFKNLKIVSSIDGLNEIATLKEIDFVMSSMSGSLGLIPTIEAIKAKKTIGLANKEVLVAAGELVSELAKEYGAQIIPVDSEHSAIFQCLKNEDNKKIKRIILTASGGPFFKTSIEDLKKVSLKQALCHPNFSMGKKITIDSSTLMNKGLEVIEAYHLFKINEDQIDVIIHPEQIIHSMVEFIDGTILAQMSEPTMEIPIKYALDFPERQSYPIKKFDFLKNSKLTFFKADFEKFQCLDLAYKALTIKKSMPCFMSKANEVLVQRFLKEEISWFDIPIKLSKLMTSHEVQNLIDFRQIKQIEKQAIQKAKQI